MKTFVKCEMCNAEIPGDGCVFATYNRVIDGKEYLYCCIKVQQKHHAQRKKPKT